MDPSTLGVPAMVDPSAVMAASVGLPAGAVLQMPVVPLQVGVPTGPTTGGPVTFLTLYHRFMAGRPNVSSQYFDDFSRYCAEHGLCDAKQGRRGVEGAPEAAAGEELESTSLHRHGPECCNWANLISTYITMHLIPKVIGPAASKLAVLKLLWEFSKYLVKSGVLPGDEAQRSAAVLSVATEQLPRTEKAATALIDDAKQWVVGLGGNKLWPVLPPEVKVSEEVGVSLEERLRVVSIPELPVQALKAHSVAAVLPGVAAAAAAAAAASSGAAGESSEGSASAAGTSGEAGAEGGAGGEEKDAENAESGEKGEDGKKERNTRPGRVLIKIAADGEASGWGFSSAVGSSGKTVDVDVRATTAALLKPGDEIKGTAVRLARKYTAAGVRKLRQSTGGGEADGSGAAAADAEAAPAPATEDAEGGEKTAEAAAPAAATEEGAAPAAAAKDGEATDDEGKGASSAQPAKRQKRKSAAAAEAAAAASATSATETVSSEKEKKEKKASKKETETIMPFRFSMVSGVWCDYHPLVDECLQSGKATEIVQQWMAEPMATALPVTAKPLGYHPPGMAGASSESASAFGSSSSAGFAGLSSPSALGHSLPVQLGSTKAIRDAEEYERKKWVPGKGKYSCIYPASKPPMRPSHGGIVPFLKKRWVYNWLAPQPDGSKAKVTGSTMLRREAEDAIEQAATAAGVDPRTLIRPGHPEHPEYQAGPTGPVVDDYADDELILAENAAIEAGEIPPSMAAAAAAASSLSGGAEGGAMGGIEGMAPAYTVMPLTVLEVASLKALMAPGGTYHEYARVNGDKLLANLKISEDTRFARLSSKNDNYQAIISVRTVGNKRTSISTGRYESLRQALIAHEIVCLVSGEVHLCHTTEAGPTRKTLMAMLSRPLDQVAEEVGLALPAGSGGAASGGMMMDSMGGGAGYTAPAIGSPAQMGALPVRKRGRPAGSGGSKKRARESGEGAEGFEGEQ